MSHGWKMWVNVCWAEGELFTSVHLTRKGAFIASIEDMVETIAGGADWPNGFRDPGDLSMYSISALQEIWDEMQEFFLHTSMDFDVQGIEVRP